MQRAWMEKGVKNARRKPRTTTRSAASSGPSRARSRLPRRGRPSASSSGSKTWPSPARNGSCSSSSRPRRAPATSWHAPTAVVRRGRLRARPGRPPAAPRRPGRGDRAERRRQVHAARPAARAASCPTWGEPRLGRRGVGEVEQARGRSSAGDRRSATPSRRGARLADRQTSARCSRSSGSGPTRSVAPPRAFPGERTRASLALLQARGVNLLVLDEPTNHLDLPAIEQLEEALEPSTARCCWSPTTGGCWTRCGSPVGGTSRTATSPRSPPTEDCSSDGHEVRLPGSRPCRSSTASRARAARTRGPGVLGEAGAATRARDRFCCEWESSRNPGVARLGRSRRSPRRGSPVRRAVAHAPGPGAGRRPARVVHALTARVTSSSRVTRLPHHVLPTSEVGAILGEQLLGGG